MTKLSDRKIRWICRHVVDIGDWSKADVSGVYGVSVRRIEQLVKSYRDAGEFPKLKTHRGPRSAPLTREEKRFGARLLYKELKHVSPKFIKIALMNLTVTVEYRKSGKKRRIFSNFSRISQAVLSKKHAFT